MRNIDFWVNFIANLTTIVASCLAIYLYIMNREKIKSAINTILNYSNQLTLNDLRYKIERLNDLTSTDLAQKSEIINILHEIEGQILGNDVIKLKLEIQLEKIQNFIINPRQLTEPRKRSLVSELKESVRNIDVSNYSNIIND